MNQFGIDLKSDERYLYYPTKQNNIFYYPKKLNLRDNDSCFEIDYFSHSDKPVAINIQIKTSVGVDKEKILRILPQLDGHSMEKSEFCIREFISFDISEYYLSISVDKSDYHQTINGFAMRFKELGNAPVWDKVNNAQNYLRGWQNFELTDIESEWIRQVPKIENFTLDRISSFNGKFELNQQSILMQ